MPFLSLREDSFPYLVSTELAPQASNAINWNLGAMYRVQTTSEIIRVNKRNIQWFLQGQTSSTASWPGFLDFRNMPSWHTLPCAPTLNAMCEVQQSNRMLLFPSSAVDMPLNFDQLRLPDNMQLEMQNVTCSSASANRRLNVDDTRYEVSLCDLTDANLEFVFKPYENILYWRQVHLSTVWLVVSTILTLYFFTKVCEHMLLLLRRETASFTHSTSTVPLILAAYLLYEHTQTQSFMLMYDEIVLHYVLLLYVIAQGLYQIQQRARWARAQPSKLSFFQTSTQDEDHINGVSVSMLLCIQLTLTAEMQTSYDNPFLQILTFIFAVRNFLKFMNLMQKHIHTEHLQLRLSNTTLLKVLHWMLDTLVLCFLIVSGFRVSADSAEEYVAGSTSLLFMSMLAGTALHCHSMCTSTQHKTH